MTEHCDPEILSKFNRLKKNYENNVLENTIMSENDICNGEMKETMQNFNHLIKVKINELKKIREEVTRLATYRDEIIDILKDMQIAEKKYVTIYQKNVLNTADLKLPSPKFESIYKLLSGDTRGNVSQSDKLDPTIIKLELFTMKEEYIHTMCDICEKIEDKIAIEAIKINKITEYINVYKSTIISLGFDKKISNKYNCTICYENEVKVCFMPCGHTFCKGCSEKANRKCFACSGTVIETKTIYLLGNDDIHDDDEEVQAHVGNDPVAYGPAIGVVPAMANFPAMPNLPVMANFMR